VFWIWKFLLIIFTRFSSLASWANTLGIKFFWGSYSFETWSSSFQKKKNTLDKNVKLRSSFKFPFPQIIMKILCIFTSFLFFMKFVCIRKSISESKKRTVYIWNFLCLCYKETTVKMIFSEQTTLMFTFMEKIIGSSSYFVMWFLPISLGTNEIWWCIGDLFVTCPYSLTKLLYIVASSGLYPLSQLVNSTFYMTILRLTT